MNKVEKMENILTKLIVDKTIWIDSCKIKPMQEDDLGSGVMVVYKILNEHFNPKIFNQMEEICRKTENIFKMLKFSMDLRFYRTSFSTEEYIFGYCDSGRSLM